MVKSLKVQLSSQANVSGTVPFQIRLNIHVWFLDFKHLILIELLLSHSIFSLPENKNVLWKQRHLT